MSADVKKIRQREYARTYRMRNLDKSRACGRRCAKRWRDKYPERARASNRRMYLKKREQRIAYAKKWAADHPDQFRRSALVSHLKRRYKITLERFQSQLTKQGFCCGVCRSPLKLQGELLPNRDVVIDHSHTTGEFRGVLCRRCNNGLGFIEIDGWAELARNYLREF